MGIYWLWLAAHTGLTEREKARLMEHFRDPEELYFASGDIPRDLMDLVHKARTNMELKEAEQILAQCDRLGVDIISMEDPRYPKRLRHIPAPPVVLYCRGSLPDLDSAPAIGVVGTRKASAYGLNTARRLGYEIARCGGIVVSGMALGIDAMAMRGALMADKPVVGVLGCGAEQVYPKSNRNLFEDTLRYGCILSEYAPGTPPNKWNFPKRNRIISGLSCGVLVVEAPEKSGSLITARQALEQGRDVFVVPGNVDLPGFAGSYRILRDGAIPVSQGWDVVGEYQAQYPDKIRQDRSQPPVVLAPPREEIPLKVAQIPQKPGNTREEKPVPQKKAIDKADKPPYSDLNEILASLAPEEQSIVRALEQGQRLVDDVIAETGLSTGKMLSSMTILELKGIIRRLPGKYIVLK